MPHDANGNLLKAGDEVVVRFIVKDVFTAEEYCNCNLESILGMPPSGSKLSVSAINTRQTEKVHDLAPTPPVDNDHVAEGCEQFGVSAGPAQ